MILSVCIGGSCHLNGSCDVKNSFARIIRERKLENRINLEVAFCLGHCSDSGVTVKADNEIITGVTPQNCEEIFDEKIMNLLLTETV